MMKRFAVMAVMLTVSVFAALPSAGAGLGDLADKARDTVKGKDKDQSVTESRPAMVNYTGPKKRLAVMDMEVKVTATATAEPTPAGGVVQTTTVSIPPPSDFGTGLTEMLTTSLIDSGRFLMFERKAIADIQAEQSLGSSGAADPDSAAKSGKLLGAQVLIRGAVTEYTYKRSSTGGNASFLKGVGIAASKAEAQVVLDIRMYDTTTGQILDSVKASGTAKSSATALDIDKPDYKMSAKGFAQSPLGEATRQAIDRAVSFICERTEKLPWEGRIAEMDTETEGAPPTAIYVNAGSDMNLKVGDKLDIYHPGRDIKDPETKTVIGRTKDKYLGQCKITALTKNLSTAELTEGQGFQLNDVVRLIEPGKTRVTPVTTAAPAAADSAPPAEATPPASETGG
jgi:curli biogenesis system outer membrane secretion channel CsgG